MAIHEPAAFGVLVETAKKALEYLKEAGTTNEFETAVK
jgi:large subunit ribosomal protein L20